MIAIEILVEAERDVEHAARWYDQQRPERRDAFLREYRATVDRALLMPQAGSIVANTRPRVTLRRFPFTGFPYSVLAVALEHRFVLIAVSHDRRSAYWRKRLAKVRR